VQKLLDHVDVLIVGAGISGIGAAHHLVERCPEKSYTIFEGRDAIGGTWDLFRYPGIRSDSDMFTLGYRFRPWPSPKTIADGPSIRKYVNDAAQDAGVKDQIRFNHWVTDMAWDSDSATWTVTAKVHNETVKITCNFLWMASGYYRYKSGYMPDFPGIEDFSGPVIHPQKWPEDCNYEDKRVVVIGSGATAVTLIPAMAEKTKHIIMLQRSPSYVFSMPSISGLNEVLKKILPANTAYWIMRWQRIIFQMVFFNLARATPKGTAKKLIKQVREKLGPDYDVKKHFKPDYNPWDQRLCLVPDDDLFNAIASGNASVETDHIERFTKNGILLKSGKELKADIIVSATGLSLEALGGATVTVDNQEISFGKTFSYKGFMYSGVPNLVAVFGYTNASWTLRADLISDFVCRLLNHMTSNSYESATPIANDPHMKTEPYLDFSSGYVKRAFDILPKLGDRKPWRNPQNYFMDIAAMRYGKLEDGVMRFEKRSVQSNNKKQNTSIAAE